MQWLGDLTEDQTIDFKFSTQTVAGVPTTLAGSPVLSIYAANGTTEITAGITLTVDFDSRTGCHHARIDTSASASYAIAQDYQVVVTAGTVGGQSIVGSVLAHFSIENRFIEADVTKIAGSPVSTTTAQIGVNVVQLSADSTAADNAEAFFDGTGYAGTGNVIPTVTSVTAIATGGITAGSIATDAIGAAELAADAVAEIQSGLATAAALTTIDDFLDTEIAAIKAKTDNLPAAPAATGDIPTVAAIADGVWDEAIAGHLTGGSTGAALNAAGSAGDPWTTTLPGAYTGSQAGKMLSDILVDTAEIGAAGAGLTVLATAANLATVAGYLDTEIATIVSATAASAIRAAVGLASANLDTQIATLATAAALTTIDDFLDTEVAAILADTNELQTDWANGGRLDLLIDAILDDTGTSGVALAAGSITAAVVATGAIDADSLAADAVAEIWGTALTEAYRGTGATGSGAQLMYELIAHLGESAIASTTKTLKKLDGSTTAKTYTLDSATTPTSITETT